MNAAFTRGLQHLANAVGDVVAAGGIPEDRFHALGAARIGCFGAACWEKNRLETAGVADS